MRRCDSKDGLQILLHAPEGDTRASALSTRLVLKGVDHMHVDNGQNASRRRSSKVRRSVEVRYYGL